MLIKIEGFKRRVQSEVDKIYTNIDRVKRKIKSSNKELLEARMSLNVKER
jgi:hypothetical protein